MRWYVWILLVVLLAGTGIAASRAAQWTPLAPEPLPARAWTPVVAAEPSTWQTLANASFEAAGATFVAELQGFPQMTTTSLHSMRVHLTRTGGADARVWAEGAQLDGVQPTRVAREDDRLVVVFEYLPTYGELSIAAELDVRVWRPVAVGYVEEAPVPVRLVAQVRGPDRP